jgi:hypothetical protein
LKAAAGFMKKNENEAFHEAILKAFWGYFSDKLGIPVANLNRESALEGLRKEMWTKNSLAILWRLQNNVNLPAMRHLEVLRHEVNCIKKQFDYEQTGKADKKIILLIKTLNFRNF